MLPTFQSLEEFSLLDCASVISEVEKNSHESLMPLVALSNIELEKMPALIQTRLNSGRNLYPDHEKLTIVECNSLRNVFLPSIAKHLLHLKDLFVTGCKMMSEIIAEEENEERNDQLVFPELTSLVLDDLPNFKSFCFNYFVETQATSSRHQLQIATKVSFPKLLVLECFLKTITLDEIELGVNDSTSQITKLHLKSDNEVQLPSKWQLQLPNIETMSLKNCWWHGSSEEHNVQESSINPYGTLSFQRLKVVKFNGCGLSFLFSCSVFKNLHQLQELIVTYCPFLEEIVGDENIVGTVEETISLLQLESIQLYRLPKLKSFSSSTTYAFNMPSLQSIDLYKFPQMENFTYLEISTPSMPDFHTQIQQYLSNPNGSEDSSDADSKEYGSDADAEIIEE